MSQSQQQIQDKLLEAMLRALKADLDEIKAMVKEIHAVTVGNPSRGLGH